MKALEERNLVWNLMELIIEKYLENSCEFLDPDGDGIIFGNFVKGHPMCFETDFKEMIAELTRKLPSNYVVAKCTVIGTGDGVIGLMKVAN